MMELISELRKNNKDCRNAIVYLQRIDPVYIAWIVPIKATIENYSIIANNHTAIKIF